VSGDDGRRQAAGAVVFGEERELFGVRPCKPTGLTP